MEGGRKKEEHIFALIHTSVDTHIGLTFAPDTTAGELRRIIEDEHPSMCPDVGAISVNAIKVKRRKMYFHLPDTIPVIAVFQGLERKNWRLYVDATTRSDKLKEEVGSGRDVAKAENNEDWEVKHTESSEKRNKQTVCSPEKAGDGRICEELVVGTTPKLEAAQEKVVDVSKGSHPPTPKSEGALAPAPAASVTGLITRYFPAEFDEVKSCHSPSESHGSCEGYPLEQRKARAVGKNAAIIHSNRAPAPAAVGNKLRARCKTQVGNRVLRAGKYIVASNKKSPVATLCQSKRQKLSGCNPRAMAFEISSSSL